MPVREAFARWTLLAVGLGTAAPAQAFDHAHPAWNGLLQKNVVLVSGGNASQVRYAAFARERAALTSYLAALSAVTPGEFEGWSKTRRLAFLINAYNAFTVELILTRYPDLKSINDLGSAFSNPWRREFVPLLGSTRSLDDIEHGMIRGVFDDPRIHAAVNCASVGCPMLRNEAFVAEKLDAQLDDSLARFLADASRNRYDAARGVLQVSRIFDWYRGDFEKGHQGIASLPALFGATDVAHAHHPQEAQRITSLHHDAPRWVPAAPSPGGRVVPAPMYNHNDLELVTLEALVGRDVPFAEEGRIYQSPRWPR